MDVDALAELLQAHSLNDTQPASRQWVRVTHVKNPYSFYVRPTTFERYLPILEQKGMEPLKLNQLHPFKMVVYHSEKLKKYIRGSITSTDPERNVCVIFACDYGFYETPKHSDFTTPTAEHAPYLAIHCRLADCKPFADTWSEKSIEAMRDYIGDEIQEMLVTASSSEGLTVKLYNSRTNPDDVAKLLALTGYSTIGYDQNQVNRLIPSAKENHYIKYKQLQPNESLQVKLLTQVNQDESFYLVEKTDLKDYLSDRVNVTYFSKHFQKFLNVGDLELNKPVAVYLMSENRYERGYIKSIVSPEQAIIQLIDIGETISVHISLIKPLSEKLFHKPATALYCKLDKAQNADYRILKILRMGNVFEVTINKVGYKFDVPNIVSIVM